MSMLSIPNTYHTGDYKESSSFDWPLDLLTNRRILNSVTFFRIPIRYPSLCLVYGRSFFLLFFVVEWKAISYLTRISLGSTVEIQKRIQLSERFDFEGDPDLAVESIVRNSAKNVYPDPYQFSSASFRMRQIFESFRILFSKFSQNLSKVWSNRLIPSRILLCLDLRGWNVVDSGSLLLVFAAVSFA